MGYFKDLSAEDKGKLFFIPPTERPLDADKETLAHALGATLYMPAGSSKVGGLIENKIPGLISAVICLEDAIRDQDLPLAEAELSKQLHLLFKINKRGGRTLPFIFIRVRSVEQMSRLTHLLGPTMSTLTGFIFPKFNSDNGEAYLQQLGAVNQFLGQKLYGMPILEDRKIACLETRTAELVAVKNLLDQYKDLILNVRIGAADLSGFFGLRRSSEQTIYDIGVVRDCIVDMVNVFGRPGEGYVISGPVWEYFSSPEYIKGLIKEVVLDKANGLTGKTIIHPSQLAPVQALYCVTKEQYMDAITVLEHDDGGVAKSVYNNKMNENKPHTHWAQKICLMAKIYGVLNDKKDYSNLISARERLQNIV